MSLKTKMQKKQNKKMPQNVLQYFQILKIASVMKRVNVSLNFLRARCIHWKMSMGLCIQYTSEK